jgi:mannan endo-1,4-beta-mannosidase
MHERLRVLAASCIIFALGASSIGTALCEELSTNIKAANSQILPQGQAELHYLAALSTQNHHAILSGQWASGPVGWPKAFDLFVEGIYQKTGKHVALLGSDYFAKEGATDAQNQRLDEILIAHWKAGGLVTLTWSADNPWYPGHVGTYCKKAPGPCVPGNLTDLTRPDTAAGASFKSELDVLADDLTRLQAAGVIVLFRPFHEMNGNWFWWGVQTAQSPTPSEFATLWKYTYHYLTETKKLNNLLWVFSPGNSETKLEFYPKWNGIKQPAPYYYPGGEYVDVTGVDVYDDRLDRPDNSPDGSRSSIPAYSQMIALGKPFGLAEFGPGSADRKSFDFDAMIHTIAENYPKVGFFMAWQDNPAKDKYLSIVNNPEPERLMNDALVITREQVHY